MLCLYPVSAWTSLSVCRIAFCAGVSRHKAISLCSCLSSALVDRWAAAFFGLCSTLVAARRFFRSGEGDRVAQAGRSFWRLQFVPCQKVGTVQVYGMPGLWGPSILFCEPLQTIPVRCGVWNTLRRGSYPLRAGTASRYWVPRP